MYKNIHTEGSLKCCIPLVKVRRVSDGRSPRPSCLSAFVSPLSALWLCAHTTSWCTERLITRTILVPFKGCFGLFCMFICICSCFYSVFVSGEMP